MAAAMATQSDCDMTVTRLRPSSRRQCRCRLMGTRGHDRVVSYRPVLLGLESEAQVTTSLRASCTLGHMLSDATLYLVEQICKNMQYLLTDTPWLLSSAMRRQMHPDNAPLAPLILCNTLSQRHAAPGSLCFQWFHCSAFVCLLCSPWSRVQRPRAAIQRCRACRGTW